MDNSIQITVKLFASLSKYKPQVHESPAFPMQLKADSTVEQVLAALHIPEDKVRTISVNDAVVKGETVLREGDYLVLFPTIAGG